MTELAKLCFYACFTHTWFANPASQLFKMPLYGDISPKNRQLNTSCETL